MLIVLCIVPIVVCDFNIIHVCMFVKLLFYAVIKIFTDIHL